MPEPECGIGSFGRLKACFNGLSEKSLTVESMSNSINGAVLSAAEAVGVTKIDPLESARGGVVGEAIRKRQRQSSGPS